MNNKVNLVFNAVPAWDSATNSLLRASGIDELIMFSNEIDCVGTLAVPNEATFTSAVADSFYIPENLSDFSTYIYSGESITRQDIKRKLAIRLPQVTLGQGLLVISAQDTFQQYFMNSVVLHTSVGYIRWGIANFTANQATNPLVDGNQGTLQGIWSFFDIDSTQLLLGI